MSEENTYELHGKLSGVFSNIIDNTLSIEGAGADAKATGDAIKGHAENKNNPHGVTAEQVGARPDTWMPNLTDLGAAPSGYGLGGKTSEFSDLNNAKNCGWFAFTKSALNTPFDYGMVMVMNRYGNHVTQVAVNPYFGDNGDICIRHLTGSMEDGVFVESHWTEWEYMNPPMIDGVEYRTTERFRGAPVYAKLVSFAHHSKDTTKIAHGIPGINYSVSIDVWNYKKLLTHDVGITNLAFDVTNIYLTSAWDMGAPSFVLKYTKT